jgi:hypothetical protein
MEAALCNQQLGIVYTLRASVPGLPQWDKPARRAASMPGHTYRDRLAARR